MTEQKIASRNFLICTGMAFCISLDFYILAVCIASFALAEFHVSESNAGLAVGIFAIGGLIGKFVFGKYIELVGRKKMILIAAAVALLTSVFYNYTNSFTGLCIIRLVHGMSYGIMFTTVSTIVSKLLPPQRRGEGMGYYHLGLSLSMCIGPLLGLYFGRSGDYTIIFSIGLLLLSFTLILAFFIQVEEEVLTDEERMMVKKITLSNMLEVSIIPLTLSVMLAYFGYSVINSFLEPYTEEIGLGTQAVFFFLVVAAGTVITRVTGKYYDEKGANILLIPAFASLIFGLILIATTHTAIQMYVSGFLMGFGYTMIFTVGMTTVMSRADANKYGVTSATFTSLVDLATGCGPMILGCLVPMIGYRGMYSVAAMIVMAAMIIYWFVFGKKSGNIPGKKLQKIQQ